MTNAEPSIRIPVYVDCDTGIDDALALAYLLTEPSIEIVGIGTVSGNVSARQAARNTLDLLEIAGRRDIPVWVGAHDPVAGTFAGGAPQVHGENGIGGVILAEAPTPVVPGPGPDHLASLAHRYSGRLRVLALGPLTNLAHLIAHDPDAAERISSVVVMGGAFEVSGNVSRHAEANIHSDPEAAGAVFAAAWPLTVVPLDLTMRHTLSDDDAREIGTVPGRVPAALASMLGAYLDFYESVYALRKCAIHDPLAALLVTDRLEIEASRRARGIDVLLDAEQRGRTIARADGTSGEVDGRIVLVEHVRRSGRDVLMERLRLWDWPS